MTKAFIDVVNGTEVQAVQYDGSNFAELECLVNSADQLFVEDSVVKIITAQHELKQMQKVGDYLVKVGDSYEFISRHEFEAHYKEQT